ncbi:MAG: WHG domain-containing protein [Anaerolineae bacterium]
MPPKKHIDLQQVVQTAIEVADENGLEAVTLASVAARLDIRIPSLYNHVEGLPGLRRELALWAAQNLADELRRASVGRAGKDAIWSLAIAYRKFARTHPGVYPITRKAPEADDAEMMKASEELLEIVYAVLRPYGFNDADLIHAVRALRSVLHGFVDLETAGGFEMGYDRDESYERLVRMFTDALELHGYGKQP